MFQGYELNLRDYWSIFLKRKWMVLLSFFIIFITTVVYTNLQPYLYRASAVVRIDPAVGPSRVYPEPYYYNPNELPSYMRQIKSAPIIEEALRQTGFQDGATTEEFAYLVSRVSESITTTLVENTTMIKIEMVSDNPDDVALIVNKVIEVFKQENMEQKNQQLTNVSEFIETQITDVSEKIARANEELRALMLKGVGNLAGAFTDKIGDLESKRVDLLTQFTKLHPSVKKIDEQILSLKEQLRNLPKEEFEFSNLKKDLEINEKAYRFLKERLQAAEIRESEKIDNVILISPAVAPIASFSPNKSGNYLIGIILGVIFGVSVALVSEHLDTSIGRIEDLEEMTKLSVIGVIPYSTEVGGSRDLKEKLMFGKNIFTGKAKKRKSQDRSRDLQTAQLITASAHKESSIFLEAFRILGANIQALFGGSDKLQGKCILITSSNLREGKSIIASNLGVTMAQMGYRVMLMDMDLRRSSAHKIFGIEKKEGGITDVLTGKIELNAAIRTTADLLMGNMSQDELLKNPWMDNFNLITAGSSFPNSPYLLNTERMDWVLKVLKEKYDVIIMDTPPVLAVSDTSIIVPKTDSVLLVYRAGFTSRLALNRAKFQVESAKKGIVKGIILNNVTPEISASNYYYYHKYYEEEKEAKG